MKHWTYELVGEPWTPVHNCWWFVREAYRRQMGIELPPLITYSEASVAILKGDVLSRGFVRSAEPGDMDILLCKDSFNNWHTGVLVALGGVLQLFHSEQRRTRRGITGSAVLEPFSQVVGISAVEAWRLA